MFIKMVKIFQTWLISFLFHTNHQLLSITTIITIITIIIMTNRLDDHAPVFIYGVEGEQIEEENDAYNDLR